jgi:hypothetical protein
VFQFDAGVLCPKLPIDQRLLAIPFLFKSPDLRAKGLVIRDALAQAQSTTN